MLLKATLCDLADELRRRVREEIGITISGGVSYCRIRLEKVFARELFPEHHRPI